jgi:chemotaxis protein MotB
VDHLDDDGDGGGEDWLISYADMMTLIACFFILMMAFANYDPVGFNIKAEELSKHFRKEKYKTSMMKFTEITEEIAKHEQKDRLKISVKDSELVVKFSSSVVFDNGKADLNPEVMETLDALIDIVKVSNPGYRILIEGHADDVLDESSLYKSQLGLSAARAVSVAQRFEYFGFPADRIVPIGKGTTQPLVESMTPKGVKDPAKAALNRRVVIRLLEPYEKKKYKFGFGIYFKDAVEDVKEDSMKDESFDDFEVIK